MLISFLQASVTDYLTLLLYEFICSMNIHVTNHEEHVLMRRFDHNGDGKISMEEFYNTLAEEFWTLDWPKQKVENCKATRHAE